MTEQGKNQTEKWLWDAYTAEQVKDPDLIPELTLSVLWRYVKSGIPTGSFLEAVLSNNLKHAVMTADAYNTVALVAIVAYIYNFVPSPCWGSPEKYQAWIDAHARVRTSKPYTLCRSCAGSGHRSRRGGACLECDGFGNPEGVATVPRAATEVADYANLEPRR